jgi:hypothetical protein
MKKEFTDFVLNSLFPKDSINSDYIEQFKVQDGFRTILHDLIWRYIQDNNNDNNNFLFPSSANVEEYLIRVYSKKKKDELDQLNFENYDGNKTERVTHHINNSNNNTKKKLYEQSFLQNAKYLFHVNEFPEIENLKIYKIDDNSLWEKGMPKFIKNPTTNEHNLINLLYAVIWKNNDIGKVKQLFENINNINQNDSFVFRYFGHFLQQEGYQQPIIDQHVLRAFALWRIEGFSLEQKFLKFDDMNRMIVKKYRTWFMTLNVNSYNLNRNIDKIFFSIGRLINQ